MRYKNRHRSSRRYGDDWEDEGLHKNARDPWVKAKALREYHEDFLRKFHDYDDDRDSYHSRKRLDYDNDFANYKRHRRSHRYDLDDDDEEEQHSRKHGSDDLDDLDSLDKKVRGIEKMLKSSLN